MGFWWLMIWGGQYKIVTVGIGEDFGELKCVPLTRRVKRYGPFWIAVTRPTLHFLNSRLFVGET